MVTVVAHRGFSGKYPECTQISFEKALELDVEMVEFDLQLSRDKELIVIHDPSVDRTSDGTGKVEDLTLAQIKALDAGSWFAPQFRGQRFLIFQEALDLLAGKVRLNVHVKADDHTREEIMPRVIREFERRRLFESAYIASDEKTIVFAKKLAPQLEICNLSTAPPENYLQRSGDIGCTILQPKNFQVDAQFILEAQRLGFEVNPFYADDEAEMRRLIECGVDGILTNFPDLLLAIREKL